MTLSFQQPAYSFTLLPSIPLFCLVKILEPSIQRTQYILNSFFPTTLLINLFNSSENKIHILCSMYEQKLEFL